MDGSILALGREQYRHAIGLDTIDRDKDGFIVLRPTAEHVDKRVATLTTDIGDLEAKLKLFRAEQAKAKSYQKTEEYKESKRKGKSKKQKKARSTLLEMVFNNADAAAEEAEGDSEEGYKDLKSSKGKPGRPRKDNLGTTYGMRFSPVVSMLYDSITDFDRIASEIEAELNSPRGQTRNMYRSSQISNLLTAKDKRLSAVKELGSIAKTVSDLEYKKEKDRKAAEGSDTTKAISSLGARYLRGVFEDDDDDRKSSKRGKGKKGDKKGSSNFNRSSRKMGYDPEDDDDDDEDTSSKKKKKGVSNEEEMAKEFAKALMSHKGEISLSPHEKHVAVEGKYTLAIVCDPLDPEHTWKFIAIDPKSGKELKGFKDDYADLIPRKKDCRMRFEISKKKAIDLNSSKTYRLLFKD